MSGEHATVIVTRTAKAGWIAEFEHWMEGIIHAALKCEGFMGINVIRPQDPGKPEYVMIFHFDKYENMTPWENSDEHRQWVERGRTVVEGEPRIERKTGLEFWFTPRSSGMPAPLRHKMAIVHAVVISALVSTVLPLIQLATYGLHPALRLVIRVVMMVLLMTYAVMPAVTRLFRPWLYKKGFV